ncbi:MAG: SPASM domain-containing protein [Myxococcales bacterium]|nr:SPASM domain-containing protein [Myxococcales bacterium]
MPSIPLPGFIEVEIGTFCNRQCAWCPNGWHERGLEHRSTSMAEPTWRALLADLADYRGWFAFHNYNEPMADPHLFERMREARLAMPNAKLELHTNGDFLTRKTLLLLQQAGCALTRVTLYPSNEKALEPPDEARLHRFLKRLELASGARVQKATKLEHRVQLESMELIVRLPRIEHYTDRVGAVQFEPIRNEAPRSTPCWLPFHSAAIDVHGALKLCCHIYDSTTPAMAHAVIGNVGEVPFTKLWRSRRMESLRRKLAAANFKTLPACAGCAHVTPSWMVPKARARARAKGWISS